MFRALRAAAILVDPAGSFFFIEPDESITSISPDPGQFAALAQSIELPQSDLVDLAISGAQIRRTPRLVRTADPGVHTALLLLRGRIGIRQQGQESTLHPDDLTFYTSSAPFEIQLGESGAGSGPVRLLRFQLPQERLQPTRRCRPDRSPPHPTSPSAPCTELFRARGITVAAWIRRLRPNDARRRLEDPALARVPVRRIATQVGYVDHSTFTRAFTAAYGNSPSAHREAGMRSGRVAADRS